MSKNYSVQHDFLFEDASLEENGYAGVILQHCDTDYGSVILFSAILSLKSSNQFEGLMNNIPITLFPPLLLLDFWPSEKQGIVATYARVLLYLVLKRLWKKEIYPIVAINKE